MIFSKEIVAYLDGKQFSNGLSIRVAEKQAAVPERLSVLENMVKDKRVVHVGFADHLPLIEQKIKNNSWLHKRMINVAQHCVGIDIDSDTVKYVKETVGISDVYALDITDKMSIPAGIMDKKWDFLILGEVLEHTDNPVQFLKSVAQNFKGVAEKMVITVPNAWDITNLQFIKRHTELINSDHRFWFTPYTLAKVGTMSGLKVLEFDLVQNYIPRSWWKKVLLKRYPMMRETVLMIFAL